MYLVCTAKRACAVLRKEFLATLLDLDNNEAYITVIGAIENHYLFTEDPGNSHAGHSDVSVQTGSASMLCLVVSGLETASSDV